MPSDICSFSVQIGNKILLESYSNKKGFQKKKVGEELLLLQVLTSSRPAHHTHIEQSSWKSSSNLRGEFLLCPGSLGIRGGFEARAAP